jgi:hypothetical protein
MNCARKDFGEKISAWRRKVYVTMKESGGGSASSSGNQAARGRAWREK